MNNIAERLVYLRGQKSRRALAEELGITESTLRNYEQGISSPNSDALALISKKLSASLPWLIFGEGPMFTTKEVKKNPARAGVMRAGDRLATYEAVPPTVPPEMPTEACFSHDIVYDVVETLEEYLQSQKRNLSPSNKAELVRQICQLVVEDEAGGRQTKPAQMLRLINGALAANS